MESETRLKEPSTSERALAAAGPVLWIAISYVDPGKWAAVVEGGARFGLDLVLLVFFVSCAAILCQYLSAHVAIATGKDLAQICREEYDEGTRVLLGIQTEISLIALDLAMVLGTAYGLNAVFRIDLFSCLLFTGFDAVLFPFLANLLEIPKAKFCSICLASVLLVFYACGVLITQSDSSPSLSGMLNKLSGENAYVLMSLLGANIAPHNFYLHSSIVQLDDGRKYVPKRALCHDHFFATVCIFSGIFLVNCMLVNVASNVFYSSGLVALTLQDALSLLDQVSRSSVASFALVLVIFFSSHLVALPWSLRRQAISHDFLGLEIPCWLHRAMIRLLAIISALYCVWSLGAESIFQLLICAQVVVALLLPSSVIPLFRVASSRPIMGAYKISHLVKLLVLSSFVAMLALKIVFVMELIFGSSDWVSNLRWNIGGGIPMLYITLIILAFGFLGVMLWLAITPLRSDISGAYTPVLKYDEKDALSESFIERDQSEVIEVQYQVEKPAEKHESGLILEKSLGDHQIFSTHVPGLNLPEQLFDSESNIDLTTIPDDKSEITCSKPAVENAEASSTISEAAFPEPVEVIRSESWDASSLDTESKDVVEKSLLKIEENVKTEKNDGDTWEPEESSKDVPESSPTLMSEGPGSFRSISGKIDDVGSGAGSLSRLAGLGRAARRQLTVILDEFWGQLFDFHGQVTQDAKTKKLDVLLGVESRVDSKSSSASVKLESLNMESTGYFSPTGGRGSDSLRTSSLYASSLQKIGQSNIGSPLGLQQRSSMWSNQMQLLDAYERSSTQSTIDPGERRYYSVHFPSSSDGYDQQPATIHGYNMAPYLNRIAKEAGSDHLKAQLESLAQISQFNIKSNSVDPYSRSLGQKPQNASRTLKPPGFHNVPVSRNSSLKSSRPIQDLSSPEPTHVKKYCSLPNISGLYAPQRDSMFAGSSSQWENSLGYGQSIGRSAREQTCSSASSWAGTALGYSDLSPKVCREAFSLQFASSSGAASLWSKQPYEQFGVADKSPPKVPEITSIVDVEAMLLRSFRCCIRKLLALEGSEWLFRQNDGTDEDLIDRVAAREKFLNEIETRALEGKLTSDLKANETDLISVPNCGDGCVWRVDLNISFGVWCIHRILELSLMESRPELWGKYTYVLNRLQGIIDLAFSKPRCPASPCFCLHLPVGYQQKPSSPITSDSLPPHSKVGRGKFTTAAMLLDMIKDVEVAISCRKGRTGTAAGDVAFPKGKENLASVLKRYKRRLSNKPVGSQETGHGSQRKSPLSPAPGS